MEEFIDKEGNKKLFPRKRTILLADVVPTKYHNKPENLRKVIAERKNRAASELFPNDFISIFNELLHFFKKHVNSPD